MARIKIEAIVDRLQYEFSLALERTVNEVLPGARFEKGVLFRTFLKHLYRVCKTWEVVPDQHVEKDVD